MNLNHRRFFYFWFFTLLLVSINTIGQSVQVGLLDLTIKNNETNFSRVRSCRHILQVAGISYHESPNLDTVLQYPVVLVSPVILSATFTSAEKLKLTNYVQNGGVLIASSMRDPSLYNLFGVTSFATHTDLKRLYWHTEDEQDYFDRIDDPLEKVISLADSSESFTEAFNIRSYTMANGAESLAHYENNLNAVVHNEFGAGHTFLLGLDLRDVIMRNLINSDLNAHRTYSNGFEPTTDSFIFFITNIIRKHTGHAVRLHTCPDCGSGVVMVTHDIDSRTAMDTMSVFAEYEQASGINSMYNITTRYFADSWMTAFYPISLDKVENVKNLGQRIASHSVGHFPDYYNTTTFSLTTTGNTPVDYQPRFYNSVTTGGNVYGEVEVSKYLLESNHNVQVKSFRAGHLAFNPRLPKALQDLGYLYNSTFSANDVLTNFPFFDIDELKFSGTQTSVLEIPMTISDASASIPFNQDNYSSYAQNWISITQKNLANNAPTVLLIHPNRHYKLLAEQQYVNGLGSDVKYMFLDDFGAYWKDRLMAQIKTRLSNDTLYVTWLNFLPQSDLSLVIDDVNELDAVRFFDGMGQELTAETLAVNFGETRYCHFQYVSGTEICNGIDDNNNGLIDEDLKFSQFLDQDQDGYGNAQITDFDCELLEGYVANGVDCNDENTVIHPNNNEFCDSLDNDCNGIVDDGLNYGDFYQDLDQDGFGQSETWINSCNQPFGFVAQDGDCNDWVNSINPSEIEICNDIDDNCNNEMDEGLLFEVYYEDLDADGIGNIEVSVIKCVLPFGFVAQHGDCQDNNANVNPNAGEQCGNGIDDNCNGEIDEGCEFDLDDDGYTNAVDCNDDNSLINPGAAEVCNESDDNCDGLIDEGLTAYFYYADFDGDGFGTNSVGYVSCWMMDGFVLDNSDCDDDNSSVNPNMTELCGNQVDEDCDGFAIEGSFFEGVIPVFVSTSLYPSCAGNAVKSANMTAGSMSDLEGIQGRTIWFSFVSNYNNIRVGLSAATGNNRLLLYERVEGQCMQLISIEHENTTGNQTLLSDDLQVGVEYWLAIQNVSGPINASAKVCFNHFVGTVVDHYYSNNTGVYSNVCNSFKAAFKANASHYQFEVITAAQNGNDLLLQPWIYTTTGASSVVGRLGSILPVNQSGLPVVYGMRVPVVYQVADAVNNLETIVAQPSLTSTLTLLSENTISMRLSDRCPALKSLNGTIAPDRTICGAIGYEWEFSQVLPSEVAPVVVQGGAYSSIFMVNSIPGVGVGKTFRVRVRPLHLSGQKGNWGAAHCMRIGSAGMILQSENQNESVAGMESRGSGISIYPNPTATGSFVLQYNGTRRGEWIFAQEPTTSESNSDREPTTTESTFAQELVMMDISGKVVFQQQVVLNGNPVEIEFGGLASGVYVVMVGEERMRLIVE
jgi:hypothetical protein